jgi:hypothetical protein
VHCRSTGLAWNGIAVCAVCLRVFDPKAHGAAASTLFLFFNNTGKLAVKKRGFVSNQLFFTKNFLLPENKKIKVDLVSRF